MTSETSLPELQSPRLQDLENDEALDREINDFITKEPPATARQTTQSKSNSQAKRALRVAENQIKNLKNAN